MSIGLTVTGRSFDLKLDMLEAVDRIASTRNIYHWEQYMADILKSICEKCQKSGTMIRFPSLLIWIAMYHLCPVGHKVFSKPTRFHMWHFKSFSMARNPLE